MIRLVGIVVYQKSVLVILSLCLVCTAMSVSARPEKSARVVKETIMVRFHEQPLVRYEGGVGELKATAPALTGSKKLDASTPDAQAYLQWLRAQQDAHINQISAALGRTVDLRHRYDLIMNGVAIKANPGDLAKIRALPEVAEAVYDVAYPPATDFGPAFIGADTIWDGSGTGGLGSTRGEGILIGVLDTGINFDHPSFSDSPADGHTYTNPFGAGNFVGQCDSGNPDFDPTLNCNAKLVGAWDYADQFGNESDGPRDGNNHGSHTASTAGGNTLVSPPITGVAPHANIIAYDVCAPDPVLCQGSATSAAAQQALLDGVDVINYSIGGGTNPWSAFDIDSHFLDLVAAGAYVAASAGNSGPTAGSTGHQGPWVSTTGASRHDSVPSLADNMASFSSQGPAAIDVVKPDLTAPGVNIRAALASGSSTGLISGTSMSSPHVAGSAALLKALHPTWTPPQIRSALMGTAVTAVNKSDGSTPADPFDMGAGRVDLGPAAQAALVLHETESNFDDANPDTGGDVKTLNIASYQNSSCVVECEFTRTVRNVRSFTTNWTFQGTVRGAGPSVTASPSTFTLASDATQEITFTVSTGNTNGEFEFAYAGFSEDGSQAPDFVLPLAIIGATLSVDEFLVESYDSAGSTVMSDVVTGGASDLQLGFSGLVPVQRPRIRLAEDPSNGDPFDGGTGVTTIWHNGLSGARLLSAATMLTSSPDLDLFVGRDTNGNNQADSSEIECTSATATALESCEIENPADGDWWILVQNWSGSGAAEDGLTLRHVVVGAADAGNFSATGPTSPAAGAPFDVNIDWDFADGGHGEYMGVMDFGSSAGNPDDIGSAKVEFRNDRLFSDTF